ncbi:MAG: hypothetical protein WBA45_06730 [Microthrixaceae bacterium]
MTRHPRTAQRRSRSPARLPGQHRRAHGTSPSGPTTASDANSTGPAIAALKDLGDNPDQDAYDTLLSFQSTCGRSWHVRLDPRLRQQPEDGDARRRSDAVLPLYDGVWPQALVD